MAEYTKFEHDFNEPIEIEDYRKALKPLGIYVYKNPNWEGSTVSAYIFSKRPLTKSEIKRLATQL